MKRLFLILITIAFMGVISIHAQVISEESEYYPKTLMISRIYTHTLGYKVNYFKQDRTLGTLWLPKEWFFGPNKIGSILYGHSSVTPYGVFYYKEGEVTHFRLYIIYPFANADWQALEQHIDYTDQFPNPQSKPIVEY